jgi:hypothetical protein
MSLEFPGRNSSPTSADNEVIERFTRWPTRRAACPSRPVDQVVLVPTGRDLQKGFSLAERLLLQEPESVIALIGDGVTIDTVWPAWAYEQPGLVLIERGVFADRSVVAEETKEFRTGILAWLDTVFEGAIQKEGGGTVFYGSAAARVFQTAIELEQVRRRIALRFPGIPIISEIPARDTGGPGDHSGGIGWAARYLSLMGIAMLACICEHGLGFLRSAPSRRRLTELRRAGVGRPSPRVWLVLSPDWLRINGPLLKNLATPALAEGRDFGMLLFGTLLPGQRAELQMRVRTGAQLWPALGELRDRLDQLHLDQIVGPESFGGFVRIAVRFFRAASGVMARTLRESPMVRRGVVQFDLRPHILPLVKLQTQDLFRAMSAEYAVKRFLRFHPVQGSRIVFAGCSLAAEVVADRLLQRGGAITVDFFHATAVNWVGAAETRSTLRVVWTHADIAANRSFGRKALLLGRRRGPPRKRARPVTSNILLMTNYVHRDVRVRDIHPWKPFQDELLRVIPLIQRHFGGRFSFRWRPHPADATDAVKHAAEQLSDLELSIGSPLEDDLEWAHVVISAYSSAALEALEYDIPVFLHVRPDFLRAQDTAMFDPARVYFYAAELIGPFTACVDLLDRGSPYSTMPERLSFEALWGGETRAIAERLFSTENL